MWVVSISQTLPMVPGGQRMKTGHSGALVEGRGINCVYFNDL